MSTVTLARTLGVALHGLHGSIVEIEANVLNSQPKLILIGLPDAALSEARDRVRSALQNAGAPLIARQVIINLSPAAVPKHGPGFDLAIALAAAAVGKVIAPGRIAQIAHLGELALDGRLRPLPGVLPAVHSAARQGVRQIVVPEGNRAEAELVPGIEVFGAISLRQLLIRYGAELEPVEETAIPARMPALAASEEATDLSDVLGHAEAIEALVTAAAGGHHMFMLGPPGAGKTMLARRLPGILPELSVAEAIEVASIASLAGVPILGELERTPPWQAPHHTATAPALAGGGSGIIRPGALARAHHGVLFLDEAPEFPRSVLDVLRQPIETGSITIHRANSVANFPARFQLVLAANPCPCGLWGVPGASCECPPMVRRKYLGRLSGPLLDRIDIQLWVPRVGSSLAVGAPAESSARARERVMAAHERAHRRLSGTPWRRNADVVGSWLRRQAPALAEDARELLDVAVRRGSLSMRGADRVLRLSWTVADLAAHDVPQRDDVRRALALRKGITQ